MHPHRRKPPVALEAIVSAMLPPSRREQVLGDLAERHADPSHTNWGPELRYLMDAATVVPAAWYGNLRRGGLRSSLPLQTVDGMKPSTMRLQAEAFQDGLWWRNLWNFTFSTAMLTWGTLQGPTPSIQLASALALVAILAGFYHQSRSAPTRPVPANLSDPQLRRFHRSQMQRQYEYLCRSIPWSFVSMLPALAVFTWGKSGILPQARAPFLVIQAIAIFGLWLCMRKTANKLRRSIEALDKLPEPQP